MWFAVTIFGGVEAMPQEIEVIRSAASSVGNFDMYSILFPFHEFNFLNIGHGQQS
jgi:hypothetical protein